MDRYPLGEHGHDMNNYPVSKIQTIWENEKKKHSKIVLMKIGRFFELFHQDADIFHKEFDLMYMIGKVAITGFPETQLDKYIDELTKKGYDYHIVLCCHTKKMEEYQSVLQDKGYTYSIEKNDLQADL